MCAKERGVTFSEPGPSWESPKGTFTHPCHTPHPPKRGSDPGLAVAREREHRGYVASEWRGLIPTCDVATFSSLPLRWRCAGRWRFPGWDPRATRMWSGALAGLRRKHLFLWVFVTTKAGAGLSPQRVLAHPDGVAGRHGWGCCAWRPSWTCHHWLHLAGSHRPCPCTGLGWTWPRRAGRRHVSGPGQPQLFAFKPTHLGTPERPSRH